MTRTAAFLAIVMNLTAACSNRAGDKDWPPASCAEVTG